MRRMLLFSLLGASLLLAGLASSPSLSGAADGDAHTLLPRYSTSVSARAHGPWGTTFINTRVVQAPDGSAQWAYCAQAPVGGGVTGGTETPLDRLSDYNSQAVRDNAHRIQAVLAASTLPPPADMQWVVFPAGSFDFDWNPVDPADWANLLHQYDSVPPEDALPFELAHRIEIVAVQAAVWHYTDGFDLDNGSFFSDQGLYQSFSLPWEAGNATVADFEARYRELVAIGDAAPVPVAPQVDVSGEQVGDLAVFTVTSDFDAVTLSSSGPDLHPYDPGTGVCDAATTILDLDTSSGSGAVCTVVTAPGAVTVSAAGEQTDPSLGYFNQPTDQQDSVGLSTTTISDEDEDTVDTMVSPDTTVPPPEPPPPGPDEQPPVVPPVLARPPFAG